MEKIRDVAFIATTINGKHYEIHYLTQDDEIVYKIDISKRRTEEIDSNDFINDIRCVIASANLSKDVDEEIKQLEEENAYEEPEPKDVDETDETGEEPEEEAEPGDEDISNIPNKRDNK